MWRKRLAILLLMTLLFHGNKIQQSLKYLAGVAGKYCLQILQVLSKRSG